MSVKRSWLWLLALGACFFCLTGCGSKYVVVHTPCVLKLDGYKGTCVSPGVLKPDEGSVVSIQCNGKIIALKSSSIADGFVETERFGFLGFRFSTALDTVGAGMEAVGNREVSPIELYVERKRLKDFEAVTSH
jgi:hypothetical protein